MPQKSRLNIPEKIILRHFVHASLQYRKDLLLAMFHPAGTIAVSVIVPYFIGRIFAGLSLGQNNFDSYALPLAIAVVAGITANRFGFSRLMRFQALMMSRLQTETLQVLLKRNIGFHNNNISGKLVSDALDYPNAYSQLSNAFFINLLPFSIIILSGLVIVLLHSIIMGLALLFIVATTIGWAYIESQRRSTIRVHRLKATKALTAHLSDTIVNAQTVKTFAREQDELSRHGELNTTLLQMRLRDWQKVAVDGSNRMAVLLVMQIAFIALTVYLVQRDPSLLGAGIFGFIYTVTLMNRLFEITTMVRQIEEGFLQAAPMTEIIKQQPEIADNHGAYDLQVSSGAITFSDVTFHYPENDRKQAVFKQLNLSIAPGKKVGLIGPSGGGKSTLTRLLLRFEDIQNGSITIDGQSIRAVTQTSLHKAIGYVPQEPLLFHRSIRENVAYGNPEATNEAVLAAITKAYALEFVEKLPEGLDTIVGERGVKLSGGQRQRIAIARAILKDAPILVLDEATSALDSESEVVIQKALEELMQGRTSIVIAHRLSTIQKMDRIIVLDDGRIVEEGTHKGLVKSGGLYATLWRHQSGGFIEE